MMEIMDVRALAVLESPQVASVLRRVLSTVGISLETASSHDDLLLRVRRGRYEGIIVDCADEAQSYQALKVLRKEPSAKTSILFGLVEGKSGMRKAFEAGATFTLEKPLSIDRAVRCFRAAHGLIVGEGRRYYRHRITLAVELDKRGAGRIIAETVDISTGGALIESAAQFATGDTLKLRFCIPGSRDRVEATGEVIWARDERAGVRFMSLARKHKEALAIWLGDRYDADGARPPRSLPAYMQADSEIVN